MGRFSTIVLFFASTIFLVTEVKGSVKGSWTTDHNEDNLVYGGQEGEDLTPTYICRADSGISSKSPGKYVPILDTCYIPNGRREEAKRSFEVLMDNSYQWKSAGTNGVIPKTAVEGGYKSSGEKLYICRTTEVDVQKFLWAGKAMLVGATRKNLNKCFAAWNGQTKSYTNFEILIKPAPRRLTLFERLADDDAL